MNIQHFPCFAHLLSNTLKKIENNNIINVNVLIEKSRNLVRFFRKSN